MVNSGYVAFVLEFTGKIKITNIKLIVITELCNVWRQVDERPSAETKLRSHIYLSLFVSEISRETAITSHLCRDTLANIAIGCNLVAGFFRRLATNDDRPATRGILRYNLRGQQIGMRRTAKMLSAASAAANPPRYVPDKHRLMASRLKPNVTVIYGAFLNDYVLLHGNASRTAWFRSSIDPSS